MKQQQADADRERRDAAEWSKGAKDNSKKEEEERKRQEKLAKQREKAELEAAESREVDAIRRVKPSPTAKGKAAAPARGAEKKAAQREASLDSFSSSEITDEFAARGLDDALKLMDNLDVSGAAATSSSAAPDRHPERRVKAAYNSFEERELPIMKKENPYLRHTQIKEMLWKAWLKSPENPMNQLHGKYDLTSEEMRDVAAQHRDLELDAFRVGAGGN